MVKRSRLNVIFFLSIFALGLNAGKHCAISVSSCFQWFVPFSSHYGVVAVLFTGVCTKLCQVWGNFLALLMTCYNVMFGATSCKVTRHRISDHSALPGAVALYL